MSDEQAKSVKFADVPDGTPILMDGDVVIKLALVDDPEDPEFWYVWACCDREMRVVADNTVEVQVYPSLAQFDPDGIWH